jgi:hypothetical protein
MAIWNTKCRCRWYSSLARQCCCPGLRTRDFLERIATAEMSSVSTSTWSVTSDPTFTIERVICSCKVVLFRQSNLFVRCWNGVLSVRSPRFDVRSACPTRQAAKVYNIVIGQKNRCSPVLMKTGKTDWFFLQNRNFKLWEKTENRMILSIYRSVSPVYWPIFI